MSASNFVVSVAGADMVEAERHCDHSDGARSYAISRDDGKIIYLHVANPVEMLAIADRLFNLGLQWHNEQAPGVPDRLGPNYSTVQP